MKNKKPMVIVGIIIIILLCIAFTTKTFQNDTFYTIKIGEDILEYGIDMKDHFSWHNKITCLKFRQVIFNNFL